jgi:hypothetical protein
MKIVRGGPVAVDDVAVVDDSNETVYDDERQMAYDVHSVPPMGSTE